MPSVSLTIWSGKRTRILDEIEDAHQSIGGSGRGRRFATLQVNYAYAMLLSSQFQAFCRDLHTECANAMTVCVPDPDLGAILVEALIRERKLGRGNANPGNIGSDFARFGLPFWEDVLKLDVRNKSRQLHLESLNEWRNAIAHDDFTRILSGSMLRLSRVRAWRGACDKLAMAFDQTMYHYLSTLNRTSPW